MRRLIVVGAAAMMLGVVSSCGVVDQVTGGPGSRERQQAQDALARWDAAVAASGGQVFVLVGELTAQVGDWELAVGDNNKLALYSGKIEAAVPLPTSTPPDALVTWEDGTTRTLRVISAAQALQKMQAASVDCDGCRPLRVTAAKLTTATVQTSRGPATAPAWEFRLEGTAVRATRIAIDPGAGVTITPPPWDSYDPPVGMSVESATGTVGGRQLTVSFTGTPGPRSEPCGADYTAEAVESANAVVILITSHPHGLNETCTAIGATRTATVELAAPLGERAVLEVRQGLPVPVTLTP